MKTTEEQVKVSISLEVMWELMELLDNRTEDFLVPDPKLPGYWTWDCGPWEKYLESHGIRMILREGFPKSSPNNSIHEIWLDRSKTILIDPPRISKLYSGLQYYVIPEDLANKALLLGSMPPREENGGDGEIESI